MIGNLSRVMFWYAVLGRVREKMCNTSDVQCKIHHYKSGFVCKQAPYIYTKAVQSKAHYMYKSSRGTQTMMIWTTQCKQANNITEKLKPMKNYVRGSVCRFDLIT